MWPEFPPTFTRCLPECPPDFMLFYDPRLGKVAAGLDVVRDEVAPRLDLQQVLLNSLEATPAVASSSEGGGN